MSPSGIALAAYALGLFAEAPASTSPADNQILAQYWNARVEWRYAGDRLCADRSLVPPFQSIDARLREVGRRLVARFGDRTVSAARGRGIFPPSQMLCDDARAARTYLSRFADSVSRLEMLMRRNRL